MTPHLKGLKTKIAKQVHRVHVEQQKLERLIALEAKHTPPKIRWFWPLSSQP
jgi:hypothetical protein